MPLGLNSVCKSMIARIHNSGVCFSQTSVTLARDFASVRIIGRGVLNTEVSARRELTVLWILDNGDDQRSDFFGFEIFYFFGRKIWYTMYFFGVA